MRFHLFAAAALVLALAVPAQAHYGMIIPAAPEATQDARTLEMTLAFSHPFTGHGMVLEKPKAFKVFVGGKATDLLGQLKEAKVMGQKAWKTPYKFAKPGVYTFFMEPTPYWEPAEDTSIIHYTKVVVPAYGDEDGWDEPIGVKTEIVPMVRPFGLFAGQTFTGQVLLDGKPVPNAEIEVEFYNAEKDAYKLASDYDQTQVVKADADGVFSMACPKAGWWGFAALNEADFTVKNPAGEDKPVELGGVLWVHFDAWTKK
ncbi:MAG: DUF4198 domain-containing protein [Desulfovibrionaceae bacterium]|jgi:cobalt/nickel transport protein|nr:DUF4198 domain-containing protein [Desulfovibrionaceae bacterium]